jgi:hypothetical protein
LFGYAGFWSLPLVLRVCGCRFLPVPWLTGDLAFQVCVIGFALFYLLDPKTIQAVLYAILSGKPFSRYLPQVGFDEADLELRTVAKTTAAMISYKIHFERINTFSPQYFFKYGMRLKTK